MLISNQSTVDEIIDIITYFIVLLVLLQMRLKASFEKVILCNFIIIQYFMIKNKKIAE